MAIACHLDSRTIPRSRKLFGVFYQPASIALAAAVGTDRPGSDTTMVTPVVEPRPKMKAEESDNATVLFADPNSIDIALKKRGQALPNVLGRCRMPHLHKDAAITSESFRFASRIHIVDVRFMGSNENSTQFLGISREVPKFWV